MPVTIWHDAKRVAICTTPKVACTELLEYVRWVEAGPALACPFVNHSVLIGGGRWESYVKSAERECELQKVRQSSQAENQTSSPYLPLSKPASNHARGRTNLCPPHTARSPTRPSAKCASRLAWPSHPPAGES